jgi:Zn-dependent M28 family amino/carboxypeptidase
MRAISGLVGAVAFIAAAGCGQSSQEPERPAESGRSADASAGAVDMAEAPTVSSPNAGSLARRIARLASDEFEGRAPATPGGEKARAYIAEEFARIGLEPVGSSYFHPVPLVESTLDPDASYFSFATAAGEARADYKKDIVYWTKRATAETAFAGAEVVFVGYGIVAPEFGWNDYNGVDAEGKVVVMLVNDPGYATGDPSLFSGKAMTYYGRWTYKFEEAARQGAAAALIIHDTAPAAYGWNVVETSWTGPQIDLMRSDDGASRVKAEGWLSNDKARALLGSAGLNFDELVVAAKTRGFRPVTVPGLSASAKIVNKITRSEDANVIGVLRGREAPDEFVLYTAHWDHLGSDSVPGAEDHVYNGAVDNATGVAAILEIAERFASAPQRPRRSVMFAAVTAEESGLLGSAYMAENPPVELKRIAAGVNIDGMVPTPAVRDVIVIGAGASDLEDVLKIAADKKGLYIRPDPEPEKGYFYRSDHVSFAKKGVPMLYADSGFDLVAGGEEAGRALLEDYVANRYHQASDEYDPSWNLEAAGQIIDILHEVGATVANSSDWPNWREGNEFRSIRDADRAQVE